MHPIFETRKLSKQYKQIQALNSLDLVLTSGKMVGLLGPNGSGKTTLLKISAGLLTPSSGCVLIDGQAPGTETKKVVSYLPDRMSLPTELTAADAIAMYGDFFQDFDKEKAHDMLKALKLSPAQRIGTMSKGTQEKFQICLTMSRSAKLYLLDEPLGGVDPAAREYILSTILRNYSENSTVLFSTHLIGDIEKALDEVVILRNGSLILHDSVDHLREEKGMSVDEYFKEVFRC